MEMETDSYILLRVKMDFQKAKTEITRFGMMPSIVGLQEALKAIDPEIYIYI